MIDAEHAVLGALLLDQRTYWRVADLIGPEEFGKGPHRRLFDAIADLIREGSAVDAVTIGELHPDLEELAMHVGSVTVSTANARTYAEVVLRNATERKVISAGQRIAALRGPETLTEAQRLLATCMPKTSGVASTLRESLKGWFADVERRFDSPAMSGLPTGLGWLDTLLGGYQPGELIILAARPSVGKTAFALQSAVAAAEAKKPALIISAEMSTPQLTGRLASHLSGVSTTAFRQPQSIDEEGWAAVNTAMVRARDLPIWIDDQSVTVEAINARARQLDASHRLGLVVIDYLTHLKLPKADRPDLAIGEATRSFKRMAKELRVPVLLLAQLNRDGANARPTLNTLRGSGDIEQDADVVVFLHRPDEQRREGIEMIVAKHRNGECGETYLHADMQRMRFAESERPTMAEPQQKPKAKGFGREWVQ